MNYEAALNAVIGLALVEYMTFSMLVGRARGKFNVPAPATTGNPEFERTFRVHQNTLEQLIVFVPSALIFGRFVSAPIACLLGLVFIAGRALYFRGYVAEASKRGLGFGVGFLANAALLLGAVIGALAKALG